MTYMRFNMAYEELSLSTQICYAILDNLSDQYLEYNHFIGYKHIEELLVFLNESLRENEGNETFFLHLNEAFAINLRSVLNLSDDVAHLFIQKQNETIDDLFERYGDTIAVKIESDAIKNNQRWLGGA